jgi:hypothetical protein
MIYFQRFFIHLCTSSPAGFEFARHDRTMPVKTPVHSRAEEFSKVHTDAGANIERARAKAVIPLV